MSWLTNTFEDDFLEEETSTKSKRGGKRAQKLGKALGSCDDLWLDRHQPQATTDLAVHKKKILEVEEWMKAALSSRKMVRILLLTGPPGSGKSCTARVLAREMGLDVLEWSNPVQEAFQTPSDGDLRGQGAPRQESQSRMFGSFLQTANRYCGLPGISGSSPHLKQLILIEELPNAYHYDPTKLHELLRSISARSVHPVLFVLSESSRNESNTAQLFPKQLTGQLGITTISFNPIAHTSLVKTLTKIATAEGKQASRRGLFSPPSKELLERLAVGSGGDLRSAVNSLQFVCTKGSPLVTRGKAKSSGTSEKKRLGKRSRSGPSMADFISSAEDSTQQQESKTLPPLLGNKDHALFLFRALGKVLYCKRLPTSPPSHGSTAVRHVATPTLTMPTGSTSEKLQSSSLPAHMVHLERAPLAVDPEEVLESTEMSAEMFTLFLHQNYLDFFSSCEDISPAAECFSDADLLSRMEWTLQAGAGAKSLSKQVLSSSVASRGVMFASGSTGGAGTSGGGRHSWRPLHKPEWSDASRKYAQLSGALREEFTNITHGGSTPSSVVLQTELVPYMAVINCALISSAQANLMQMVCNFPKKESYHFRSRRTERLEERDIQLPSVAEEGDYQNVSFSLSQPQQQQQQQQQQHLQQQLQQQLQEMSSEVNSIEDFSDDDQW